MEKQLKIKPVELSFNFYSHSGPGEFHIINKENLVPLFQSICNLLDECRNFLGDAEILEIGERYFGVEMSSIIDTLALVKKFSFYGSVEFNYRFHLKDLIALENLLRIIEQAIIEKA